MMFLVLLAGFAYAQSSLPAACTQGEFMADGYFTGQNIDMNYEESMMLTDNGETKLKVQFFVPRRYTETYEANAFAITFNRNVAATEGSKYSGEEEWKNKVELSVGQDGAADQTACYSNRYDNYTYCETGGANLWTFAQNAENECITDASATIDWVDVMGDAFANKQVVTNGIYTEIILTATVETWTHFVETTDSTYVGQMTGGEQWLNTDIEEGDTNRKGAYAGDGGWTGVGDEHDGKFPPLIMDDERYTLYQIPFILRFPRTVVVDTSFTVASDITVLSAVVSQDTIQVDLNPGEDGKFATLEVVLTTQVQYPYSIRGPDDPDAPMNVVVGSSPGASDGNAESIEVIEYTDGGACGGTGACVQEFKVRITPSDSSPCSVEGPYFFEFWATCQNGGEGGTRGCAIDDIAEDADTGSNAYFSKSINIKHQPFCPVLMDEVRVVGDLRAFHDEAFKTAISSTSVFTNDNIFFEAEYRTASASASNDFTNVEDNDFDGDAFGNDDIIDYVRATKIFMDVTIGKGSDGSATADWNGDDFNDNFDFTEGPSANPLGGTRIPNTDIAGDGDITVIQSSGDAAVYNIVLCDVPALPAGEIMWWNKKPVDCFTNKGKIAVDFLDFEAVTVSSEPTDGSDANTIDENEVAFEMRLDERIIPLKPLKTDGSHVKVTIEAEVYYKGNRQATRRLLQSDNIQSAQQKHAMSMAFAVQGKVDELKKCTVDQDTMEGHLSLELTFESEKDMPSPAATLDWTSMLSTQLSTYLGARGAVSVQRVEKCNDKSCKRIYNEGQKKKRRLQGEATHMKVTLKVSSVKSVNAGITMNKIQDHLINKQSKLYLEISAFDKADVSNMKVEGCNESDIKSEKRVADVISSERLGDEEQESSAAPVSLFFASLLSLWLLF